MDPLDNTRETAQEVVSFAKKQGVDLEALRNDIAFQKDSRWIEVWRKDSLPGTGPVDEPLGTLHFAMQGPISRLPGTPRHADIPFYGSWSEAGTLESVEQAFGLVKAWLLDAKEVDDLPPRRVRRSGTG
jgi:hypothetical protein